jgi:hypothetical protein
MLGEQEMTDDSPMLTTHWLATFRPKTVTSQSVRTQERLMIHSCRAVLSVQAKKRVVPLATGGAHHHAYEPFSQFRWK